MAAGPDGRTDAAEAEELALDPQVFQQHGHPHGPSGARPDRGDGLEPPRA